MYSTVATCNFASTHYFGVISVTGLFKVIYPDTNEMQCRWLLTGQMELFTCLIPSDV